MNFTIKWLIYTVSTGLIYLLVANGLEPVIKDYGFSQSVEYVSPEGVEPLGEIVKGFRFEQKLIVPNNVSAQVFDDAPLCIQTQMATYGDRSNRGSIDWMVHVLQPSQKQTLRMDVTNIQDGENRLVCFDQFKHRQLFEQDVRLTVMGVDSLPGQAVTLWMSQNIPDAQATLNGAPTAKSLRLFIGKRKDSLQEVWAAKVLMLIFSLVVTLLILQLSKSWRNEVE
jgi:hypothetical protein